MNKKILLVEPVKEEGVFLKKELSAEGYEITVIENPNDIRPSLSKEKFDAILMDIDVPATYGNLLEICKDIKRENFFNDLALIAQTDGENTEKIEESIDAGFDNFIFDYSKRGVIPKEAFKDSLGSAKIRREKKTIDRYRIELLLETADHRATQEKFLKFINLIVEKLIFKKINFLLGENTAKVLFKRAVELSMDKYPFLSKLSFERGKPNINELVSHTADIQFDQLKMGLKEYVNNFLELIEVLTQDIVVGIHAKTVHLQV
ncbi:two component transcriptional regulator [Candidatus Omnitrophus magneticus]|uniref:Two component transcriptional regulator n=1 Tax=Candidatus Omnitrophus magneticus TaxID=1609969 RepID=A0A0F0CKG9_9BACT|nr:two component transcriptional regulator [Candidatus Omnitrophus magneticus]